MTEKQSYQQKICALLKSLTRDGTTTAIPKIFVKEFKHVATAYFYSELLYWEFTPMYSKGWLTHTPNQGWAESLGMTPQELCYAISELEELGLIEVKDIGGSPFYQIDRDAFVELKRDVYKEAS